MCMVMKKAWGAVTLKTNLDRVSIRRLMSYIKKRTTNILSSYIFELSDQITMDNIENTISCFLEGIKTRKGLCDFNISKPKSNRKNEIEVSINIKPIQTTNYVTMNFNLGGDIDVLSQIVNMEVTKCGFIAHTKLISPIFKKCHVIGLVGVESNFVCNPSVPTSKPFFVINNNRHFLLCDGSYSYFSIDMSTYRDGDTSEYTTKDMELINAAIDKYVNQ